MSNAFAKATLDTFKTIVGGVLASERKRLGAPEGDKLIGEWMAGMLVAAYGGSRREAGIALLGLGAAACAAGGLPIEESVTAFRQLYQQAQREWQPVVDKAAADAASEALNEARRK